MSPNAKLLSLSSVEMRRLIGSKEISPVELLEACLERFEQLNPAVNAVTGTAIAAARRDARICEARALKGEMLGPLHGLPTGVKDVEETKGLLTTYGSPIFKDHVPDHDTTMVARLRAAGALIVAKTNTPEFAAGANTRNAVWGATGNPFNPLLNAGGSSGGSAVALATDMLPVCTGGDLGGSLRIPAAINGIVGFRPSPGLVPNSRLQRGWVNTIVGGPMGRTVADTCQLLSAQAGYDAIDPMSYPVDAFSLGVPAPVDLGHLRVAWTEDFGQCPVSNAIRNVFRKRIDQMKHLFRLCNEVQFDFGEADRCFDVLRAIGFVERYRSQYEHDRTRLGPNIRANYELASKMTLVDAAWAETEQTTIYRRFQKTFDEYDLVLAPTVPVTPFPWTEMYLAEVDGIKLKNYYHWLALTYVITLVNNPTVSLPAGVDHAGMPFGIQVVGRMRGDHAVLSAAHAMEQAFGHIPELRRPRPDLSRLSQPVPELKSIATDPPLRSEMG